MLTGYKKKNLFFFVLPPVFSCVPMHSSGLRGVWQSALPRILHLSDRLYCIQTSEVKGIGLMPLCVFMSF